MSQAALDAAVEAARAAGQIALKYYRGGFEVTIKPDATPVTQADREAERAIVEILGRAFPDHGVLGEEFGGSGSQERRWIIDPIDGTKNYVRGVPFWNVAVAYVEGGRAEVAVTFDAAHGELYHARRGFGAWVETPQGTRRHQVADATSLGSAFVALGHHDRAPSEAMLAIRRRMMEASVAMRNFGSGALQLAYVARGRFDGFIELELSIWDATGALLIVEEAGGRAAPFMPSPITAKAVCIAGTRGIFDALVRLVDES